MWQLIQDGWGLAFRRDITADQLQHPPTRGETAHTPAEVAWCMDAIRALEARLTPDERVTLKLPPPTNPLPPATDPRSRQPGGADPRSRQPGGASAEGGVDILGMDPLKPETLDFSKVPNPPTDATFGIYRAGFACAIVFYYSTKLQRDFRPFWNALNQGWKAYYRKPLSSDQLVHPPQRDDIA